MVDTENGELETGMDLEEYFVEGILDDLGLKYVKESSAVYDVDDPNDLACDYVNTRYCVAKTDDVARLVHELFGKIGDDGEAGLDAMRRLGELFGFPETAIDYYIQMERDGHTYKANKEKKYHSYIHSEEHGEEEYEQYESRINGLFKKYCPQSAMEFLDESE